MALTFGALMTLGFAIPAQAAEPTYVEVSICDLSGGDWRVPAQSDTYIYYGWLTKSRRQAVKFLDRSRVDLTIDGQPIPNADRLWTKPTKTPSSGWVTLWQYPIGRLGHGNSINANFQLTFTQRSWDGFGWFEPGLFADHDCRVFTRA
jgi:hypothetical protein